VADIWTSETTGYAGVGVATASRPRIGWNEENRRYMSRTDPLRQVRNALLMQGCGGGGERRLTVPFLSSAVAVRFGAREREAWQCDVERRHSGSYLKKVRCSMP
jgi:hypothetical protein